MKIALYVHCFFPTHFYGTEAYTLALAKELTALGHDCVIVSTTLWGEPAQGALVEEYSYDGLRVVSIDKNLYREQRVRDTYEQPALRHVHERILRKLKPDLVHVCHLISHTSALLDVTRRMGIPTFATLTDFFGFCYNNVLENTRNELCAGPGATRANCIACFLKLEAARPGATPPAKLANFPAFRPTMARALAFLGRGQHDAFVIDGFAPNDIVVRPGILQQAMGVYREAIAPTQFLKTAYTRNDFPAPLRVSHFGIEIDRAPKPPGPEAGKLRLGFIGQIAPHKGVHLLLDALARCGRDNLSLTIWGPANQAPAYTEKLRARAQGLPVAFAGTIPRSELAAAFASVDALVIPSTWYENSPLILLQALATHTPPIVSDVPGMTEFVAHGQNGFHFERGNVDSLARVLQTLADDPALVERLGAATSYGRVPADMAKDVAAMYADHGTSVAMQGVVGAPSATAGDGSRAGLP
jgi:glycosyltransferase involved in cell wall biosynthesis